MVDLRREGIDLAIRYGRGLWPGMHIVRLFDLDVTVARSYYAVCPPERLVDPAVRAVLECLIEEAEDT